MIIIGSGGHAGVIAAAAEYHNYSSITRLRFEDLNDLAKKLYSKDNYLLMDDNFELLIGIGDNYLRSEIDKKLNELDLQDKIGILKHSTSFVDRSALIESGTVIMAGSIIQSGVNIGKHCIVNTKASIDHDSTMEDFSSLAPGTTLGGNVKIGRTSAICIGATISHNIKIGENVVVGANSYVNKDLPSDTTCYGSPARVIRERGKNDVYL